MNIQQGETYTTPDGLTVKIVNIKVKLPSSTTLHNSLTVVIKCEFGGEIEYVNLPADEAEVKTWTRIS